MSKHHLTVSHEMFESVAGGAKTITLDDNGYQAGDSLMLDDRASPRWRLRYVEAVERQPDGSVVLTIYSDGVNP